MYYGLYIGADKIKSQNQWDDPVLIQSSLYVLESCLIEAGLAVIDSSKAYPDYLVTASNFYDFWDDAKQGRSSCQEIIAIQESGALSYRLFVCQDGVISVYFMTYPVDGTSDLHYEKHKILEWKLSDKGNFYYRIYPEGDKHYSDYSLIRMNEPDRELHDLTMKYIWAGGYIGTNLFLTDWEENGWGNLSFNDLWEYLYYDYCGEQFRPEGYTYSSEEGCYKIPAAQFENVILPYFDIDLDTFRKMAHYDAEENDYPWWQIQTNDFIFLYYYMVEPEVTQYIANSNGTITLTVEMLCTDIATDCLFAHEVTVRPLENGKFQFVGNKIIYQTEYGLPYSEPRMNWEDY